MILKSSEDGMSLVCIVFRLFVIPSLKDDRRFMFPLFGEDFRFVVCLLDGEVIRCVLLNAPGLTSSRFCQVIALLLLIGLSMVLFERCLMNWSLLEADVLSLF